MMLSSDDFRVHTPKMFNEIKILASLTASLPSTIAGVPLASSKGDDEDIPDNPDERARLMAEIIVATSSEDAVNALLADLGERKALAANSFLAAGDWDESKHPRDERGRFGEGGGGAEKKSTDKKEQTPKQSPKRESAPRARAAESKVARDKAAKLVGDLKSSGREASHAEAKQLLGHLSSMTVQDLHGLKKDFGLKASGRKAELIDKLHVRLKDHLKSPAVDSIDHAKPIQDRLAGYRSGDAKVGEIIAGADRVDKARTAIYDAAGRRDAASAAWRQRPRKEKANFEAAKREHEKAIEAYQREKEKFRNDVLKTISAKEPLKVSKGDVDVFPEAKPGMDAGLEFINKVVERKGDSQPHVVHFAKSDTSRPHYDHTGTSSNFLSLNPGPTVSIAQGGSTDHVAQTVHELGHHIERTIPGVAEAAKDFWEHRVGDEKPTNLKEAFPNSNFDSHEYGYKDQFDRAFQGSSAYYCGKIYDGKSGGEIVSMGIEKLYTDPAEFARKDPEYCKFIIGILDGSLRKKA